MNKRDRESGQGLVEYALVLVLVALAVMLMLTLLGGRVVLAYANVLAAFNGDSLDDNAVMLNSSVSGSTPSGFCNVTLEDVSFVVTDADGNLLTGQTVSATVVVDGSPTTETVSGKAGSGGIATDPGPINLAGNCPLNITLSN